MHSGCMAARGLGWVPVSLPFNFLIVFGAVYLFRDCYDWAWLKPDGVVCDTSDTNEPKPMISMKSVILVFKIM